MSAHLHISSSSVIGKHKVYDNGKPVLEYDKDSDKLVQVYRQMGFDYPRFFKMDGLSKVGWLAAEILLKAGKHRQYNPEDTAIVLVNSSSSLDTDIRYYDTVHTMASPALFVYTLPNIVMGEISIRHQVKGENAMFISESFDSGFLKHQVQNLIETGAAEACICGWLEYFGDVAEACLMFVEKAAGNPDFEIKNIDHIYQLTNG